MKLDRNINGTGRGKYGLVNNRELIIRKAEADAPSGRGELADSRIEAMKIVNAINFLEAMGIIDWGEAGTPSEFFVIKLRDQHAQSALIEYARAALDAGDVEYYHDVRALSDRAGVDNPFCKKPD